MEYSERDEAFEMFDVEVNDVVVDPDIDGIGFYAVVKKASDTEATFWDSAVDESGPVPSERYRFYILQVIRVVGVHPEVETIYQSQVTQTIDIVH